MDCEGMGKAEFTVRFHMYFRSVNGDGGKSQALIWSHR